MAGTILAPTPIKELNAMLAQEMTGVQLKLNLRMKKWLIEILPHWKSVRIRLA
jgi:hypothetical protein